MVFLYRCCGVWCDVAVLVEYCDSGVVWIFCAVEVIE